MKKIDVQVTREDLERGVRLSVYCCPISRAIRRQIDGWSLIAIVDGESVYFWKTTLLTSVEIDIGESPMKASLPLEAKELVRRFDSGEACEPLTFELMLTEKEG